jgi:hypothetical protein
MVLPGYHYMFSYHLSEVHRECSLTIDGSGVTGSREEDVAGYYVDIVSESDIVSTENLYLQPCKMREVNCGSKLPGTPSESLLETEEPERIFLHDINIHVHLEPNHISYERRNYTHTNGFWAPGVIGA